MALVSTAGGVKVGYTRGVLVGTKGTLDEGAMMLLLPPPLVLPVVESFPTPALART
jgi:hypothetical protein